MLDTHVFLWAMEDSPRLSRRARKTLRGAERYLSLGSVWELVIKISLRKLRLSRKLADVLDDATVLGGIKTLPITQAHLLAVGELPLHHGDPFDRLLIAQAIAEDMPIVTADDHFDAYDVKRLW